MRRRSCFMSGAKCRSAISTPSALLARAGRLITEPNRRRNFPIKLAYAGLTVISGLARGIDTAAHQGALAAKGRTIAVIGSGLSKLYPPENAALAEKIRSGNGAVVSEFSMEIEPDRQTFPMRNRIISGWSHGILVVEAGLNSGALITASQAIEQGRSVYAVPGHINAPSAMGSNRLIQQGAKLVMDASDILDDLQILLPETKPIAELPARPLPELSDDRSAASMTRLKRAKPPSTPSRPDATCQARRSLRFFCAWN